LALARLNKVIAMRAKLALQVCAAAQGQAGQAGGSTARAAQQLTEVEAQPLWLCS